MGIFEDANNQKMVVVLWMFFGRHFSMPVEYAIFFKYDNQMGFPAVVAECIPINTRGSTCFFPGGIVTNAKSHRRLVYCGISSCFVAISLCHEYK